MLSLERATYSNKMIQKRNNFGTQISTFSHNPETENPPSPLAENWNSLMNACSGINSPRGTPHSLLVGGRMYLHGRTLSPAQTVARSQFRTWPIKLIPLPACLSNPKIQEIQTQEGDSGGRWKIDRFFLRLQRRRKSPLLEPNRDYSQFRLIKGILCGGRESARHLG